MVHLKFHLRYASALVLSCSSSKLGGSKWLSKPERRGEAWHLQAGCIDFTKGRVPGNVRTRNLLGGFHPTSKEVEWPPCPQLRILYTSAALNTFRFVLKIRLDISSTSETVTQPDRWMLTRNSLFWKAVGWNFIFLASLKSYFTPNMCDDTPRFLVG